MKNGGFSLLELVVVMLILGTLLAIAGLSGKQWLDRYNVENQMKVMYIDLMNARTRAMQKNRMHFVTFPTPQYATQYAVYEDTNPAPDGDGALQQGSDTQVLQKELNAYAVTSGSSEIDFDSRGIATGLTGTQTTIRVIGSFGAAYDCITVSATRIRLGAYDGTTCVAQ